MPLLFAALLSTEAMAQSSDLAALNAEVSNLYQQGRYGEAIPIAQRALAMAEKLRGRGQLDLVTAATNLALLYQAAGSYAKAEPLLKRALATAERSLGSSDPNVGSSGPDLGPRARREVPCD